MNNTKGILKTLRLPNLVMLAVVQFIVSSFIIAYYSFPYYLLLTFSTICIALGGYLLNDIQDLAIDNHNNKLGWINSSNKSTATIIAIALNAVGLLGGFYASSLSKLSLFPYFVAAALALILYAYFFSRYKIIGNFIISALIALAILLVYYLELHHAAMIPHYAPTDHLFVWIYAALGFLLNWIRELSKDAEDIEGDILFNRSSIPIIFGNTVTKFFIGFVMFGFMVILSTLLYLKDGYFVLQVYLVVYILLFLLSFIYLIRTKTQSQFQKLNLALKVLMFIGLLLPIAIKWF